MLKMAIRIVFQSSIFREIMLESTSLKYFFLVNGRSEQSNFKKGWSRV
jgi:hypothetical protein